MLKGINLSLILDLKQLRKLNLCGNCDFDKQITFAILSERPCSWSWSTTPAKTIVPVMLSCRCPVGEGLILAWDLIWSIGASYLQVIKVCICFGWKHSSWYKQWHVKLPYFFVNKFYAARDIMWTTTQALATSCPQPSSKKPFACNLEQSWRFTIRVT